MSLLAWATSVHAQDAGTQTPEGVISGIVFSQDNTHPASQVAVSLRCHDAGVFRSILTDYDGRFEVRGLPPGTYEISIEEQGYETFLTTAQLDGLALKLELHLTLLPPPQTPGNPYTVSVRELKIPGNAHHEYNMGLERLAKKDQDGSLNHFMKAAKLFPGYFEAFYHEGLVHLNLGQMEKAMQAFQKSLDLSGGRYAKAVFGIGYLHYLKGMTREAETIIRRGLEIDPNSADGYVILGMTLLKEDRPEEAEKSAREALLRDPKMANAYLVLADSCARRQDYFEQIQDLDSYLKLEPTSPASKHVHEVREAALKILNRIHPLNQVR